MRLQNIPFPCCTLENNCERIIKSYLFYVSFMINISLKINQKKEYGLGKKLLSELILYTLVVESGTTWHNFKCKT